MVSVLMSSFRTVRLLLHSRAVRHLELLALRHQFWVRKSDAVSPTIHASVRGCLAHEHSETDENPAPAMTEPIACTGDQ